MLTAPLSHVVSASANVEVPDSHTAIGTELGPA